MTDWPLQKYDPGAPTPNTPEPLCVCVCVVSGCVCVCVGVCGVWRGVEWDQKKRFQSPDH